MACDGSSIFVAVGGNSYNRHDSRAEVLIYALTQHVNNVTYGACANEATRAKKLSKIQGAWLGFPTVSDDALSFFSTRYGHSRVYIFHRIYIPFTVFFFATRKSPRPQQLGTWPCYVHNHVCNGIYTISMNKPQVCT